MSTCRFMFNNFIPGPQALGVSSARPGMVGSPAAEALGSATCLAAGEHTGALDQVLVVEIDSVEAGTEVGLATFRWKRESAGSWEATGVPTSVRQTPLIDGVSVKWVPGPGQEFYKGDRWSVLAAGCQGPQALMDRDRDTGWRSLEAAEQFIEVDLGQAQPVRAMVLADHNLSETATVTLKATDTPEPDSPVWSFDPAEGLLVDSLGQAGSNARSTGRTYIDGGVLKYAAAGESCFEDGKLTIEPEATNLLTYSEQLDNAAWNKVRCSISADAVVGPDGNITADKFVEDLTAAQSHYLVQGTAFSDDTIYTLSVFAKAGERQYLELAFRTKNGNLRAAYFDVANGTVGNSYSGSGTGIEALGLGWYRCWLSYDIGSGESTPSALIMLSDTDEGATNAYRAYDGDGASGLYLGGAQLEAGTVPTAYIPTVASTVSRAADAISFALPQEVKNLLSVEQPTPTAVLDQSAGNIVLATVAGGAMAMPDDGSSVDLSPYTGQILKVVDSAGKTAWARIAAAGAGETLSSELISNGDFSAWTGDNPDGWAVYGTETETNYITENPPGSCEIVSGDAYMGLNRPSIADAAKLYKLSTDISAITTSVSVALSGGVGSYTITGNRQIIYATANGTGSLFFTCLPGRSVTLDNVSLKQVLTPPATGVTLESAPGAADKTWAHIDSGFNPNSISTWAVYSAGDWMAQGTLVVRGVELGFSADDASAYTAIVSALNSKYSLIYLGNAGSKILTSYDGTSNKSVNLDWAAHQPLDFALRWDDGPGSAQVGDKLSAAPTWTWGGAAAFDGGFVLGTRLNIGYAASYPFKVGSIKFYDSWLADPLEKTLAPWDHPEYSQALSITNPHLMHFMDQTYRFWRLELDDPGNPEGMLRASLIYLGDGFQPQRTFRAGYGQGSVATRKLVTSSGGKLAGSSGAVAAYYQLEFSRLDHADAARFEAMLAAVHAGGQGGLRPLFFTPFTDDPGQTLYCLPGAELSRQAAPGGRWGLGLRLEEVVKSDV